MQVFQLKLGKCRLNLRYELGTEFDDMIGSCEFVIPGKFYKPLREYYGEESKDFDWSEWFSSGDPNDGSEPGDYYSYSPDEYIHFLRYLIDSDETYLDMNIQCENPIWLLHDSLHAKMDFVGTNFYCSPPTEIVRMRQAFKMCVRRGVKVTREYLENWAEQFNQQSWGCYSTYQRKRKPISADTILYFKEIDNIDVYEYN